MTPSASSTPARNPGPSWGYGFLRVTDRVLPEMIYRPLRAAGTLIAMAGMPVQRRHSREYLTVMLGRTPTWLEIFRHFFSFEETLMLRLRVANGRNIPCDFVPGSEAFRDWFQKGGPMLLGTIHVGVSDMLGFQLAGRTIGPIHLVRQRVANSHDTEALAAQFGEALRFIWVNNSRDSLFALKEALSSAGAVAIQCDRIEPGIRTEAFDFLGARRLFPFTIYHLALIFERPVLLSFGVSGADGRSRLHASPLFARLPGETKEQSLARARGHFQDFLRQLEAVLRINPWIWFNFIPLNPVAEPGHCAAK